MKTNDFDPLAYIESAFLDKKKPDVLAESDGLDVAIPSIKEYLGKESENGQGNKESLSALNTASAFAIDEIDIDLPKHRAHNALMEEITDLPDATGRRTRFKKTMMSAPRPRRAKRLVSSSIDADLQATWETLPKSIEFLFSFYDDSVTANYYRGNFKEDRNALIKRLLDPQLTLEETSRLLGVCPATVRRYTNRGWLTHHRTDGGQRRFRLSDIVKFVEVHGRFPEE